MALVGARVSDFSHKSMNCGDDSKIFYDPPNLDKIG